VRTLENSGLDQPGNAEQLTKPNPKPETMKKFIRIFALLALIGILAAWLIWKFYVNKPHEDIEKAVPAYTMSAEALWKIYNSSLKEADSLYTGKVIEVTGTLNRTDKTDSLVYAVFVMEADSMFGDKSVRCEMLPKYNGETSAIAPGTGVRIKGFCNGFDQTDIKFGKCSVVK
jgi:hypothetical protein